MSHLWILILCLISFTAAALPIPDIVCRETRLVLIAPKSLAVQEQESQTVYRFKSGSLYITPSDRGEYRYNKVVEVEPMRYVSGHKIIQFEVGGSNFQTAIFVHTYLDEVRVSRATCSHSSL